MYVYLYPLHLSRCPSLCSHCLPLLSGSLSSSFYLSFFLICSSSRSFLPLPFLLSNFLQSSHFSPPSPSSFVFALSVLLLFILSLHCLPLCAILTLLTCPHLPSPNPSSPIIPTLNTPSPPHLPSHTLSTLIYSPSLLSLSYLIHFLLLLLPFSSYLLHLHPSSSIFSTSPPTSS